MIGMEYKSRRLDEGIVLAAGEYKGFHYYVISYGTHPCCYIEIPEGHKYFNMVYEDIDFECHGGLTFSESCLRPVDESGKRWFIGWDYAHCYDYVGYYMLAGFQPPLYFGHLKKWTTVELILECLKAIKQLV